MTTQHRLFFASLLACSIATAHAQSAPAPEDDTRQDNEAPQSGTATLTAITVYGRHAEDSVQAIPQSVNVYDQESFGLTAATTVGDVLQLTPGASRSGSGRDMFSDSYLIRGFDAQQAVNGLGFQRSQHPSDLANVERLEVLKGPASVLYGEMEPGGTINVVTKQPLDYYQAEATAEYGHYDHHRTTLDVTGPLNDRVRARLNLAYQDSKASLDYWEYNRVLVAPTVTMDLTERTNLTVEAVYSGNEWTALPGGAPLEGALLPNPNGDYRASFNSAWRDAITERNSAYINTRLTHALTEHIDARLSYAYTRNEGDWQEYAPLGLAADQRTLNRAIFVGDDTSQTDHEIIADLSGQLTTGAVSHKFVAGVNYRDSNLARPTLLYGADPVDIYVPVNNGMDLSPGNLLRDRDFDQDSKVLAGFAQNRMTFKERWHLLTGVRYTDSEQSQVNRDLLAGTTTPASLDETAWTYQLGLVRDLNDSTSVYVSRVDSFVPQSGTTSGLKPVDAEESVQYETGVRVAMGRIQLDAAGFVITKDNTAISDPANPGSVLAQGKARSRGGELTLSGYVSQDLFLSLGYGYTDTEVLRSDNAAVEGNPFANVPLHTASLQTRYHLATLPGVSLGGTLVYAGERAGDPTHSFDLPSYTRFDLAAYYMISNNLQLDLLANNVTDEEIYSPGSFSGVLREEGRTYLARVKYFF